MDVIAQGYDMLAPGEHPIVAFWQIIKTNPSVTLRQAIKKIRFFHFS